MTLYEFLKARFDEDEAAAQRLARAVEESPGSFVSLGLDHPDLAMGDCPSWLGEMNVERARAEVEAKRRLVADTVVVIDRYAGGMYLDFAWNVLRLLALPYAGNPDYDETWRP